MLKRRFTKQAVIFRKKKTIKFYVNLKPLSLYRTNYTIINLVKVSLWLKKTYKRFKKRNVLLYLNIQNNLIRTYKSKNARMGKGKGQLRRYTISHINRIIGSTEGNSRILTQQLRKSFFKVL